MKKKTQLSVIFYIFFITINFNIFIFFVIINLKFGHQGTHLKRGTYVFPLSLRA